MTTAKTDLAWVPLHFIPQPDVRERSDELIWRMWDAAVREMDKQEQS